MNKMSYTNNHTEDECDKCLKKVGRENLTQLEFLYMDKNDKVHPDQTPIFLDKKRKEIGKIITDKVLLEMYIKKKYPMEKGYRQYYVCKECYKRERKR